MESAQHPIQPLNPELPVPVAESDDALVAEYQPVEIAPRTGDDYIVISRTTFNYVIVGATFLVLGLVLGVMAARQLDDVRRTQTSQVVTEVLAAVLDGQAAAGNGAAQPASAVGGHSGGAAQQPNPNNRFDVSVDDDPFRGPEDAPIVIVEFSDYRCPFCGRFARETLEPLLADFEGQIRFVYRDFPILGNESLSAANAAECSDDQGAYWAYHDLLFANQSELGREMYIALAGDAGMDVEQFTACLDAETHRDEVLSDFAAAQNLGASGTPTFFINGRLVSGAQPLAVFATVINEELAALAAEDAAGEEGEDTDA